jgi:hypothetical protein
VALGADAAVGPAGPVGAGRAAPPWALALAVAAAAAVPALAAMPGRGLLLAALAVEQALFAAAWGVLLRATLLAALTVLAGALAADLVVLVRDTDVLGDVAGIVGVAVAIVVAGQLARRGRSAVTADMAAALGGVATVAFLSGYLPLRAAPVGDGARLVVAALVAAGTAVVVARLVAAVPAAGDGSAANAGEPGGSAWWPLSARIAGACAGAGAAAAYGALAAGISTLDAAAVGAAAGCAAAIVDLATSHGRGGRDWPSLGALPLVAVLPLAAASPVAFGVGKLLAG